MTPYLMTESGSYLEPVSSRDVRNVKGRDYEQGALREAFYVEVER